MRNAIQQIEHDVEAGARLRWARLAAAIEQLSSSRSLDEIVEIVRESARDIAGADGVTFVLRDGDLCHYVAENAISPLWVGQRFPMSACISGWCMLNGRSAVIPDIYADKRIPLDAYRLTFVKSLVMTPVGAGEPLAAIGAYWAQRREPDAETVSLLETLARSTATAVANVQLFQSLAAGEKAARRQVDMQRLLIDELNHRVKNTLAIVQAIAAQTSHRARDPAEFAASLSGRLNALARAHDLFTRTARAGVDLAALIKEQLAISSGGDDRIAASGPEFMLEPQAAQHLGLVLYELGTNARKHGALSTPAGRVDITWSVDAEPLPPRLLLRWVECDGPEVEPPGRRGFGSLMIEQGLRHIGAQAYLDFEKSGLRCEVRLPA
jgi:two-component sensor histidine kinase